MRHRAIPWLCLVILLSTFPVLAQGPDSKEASPSVERSEVEALKHELKETQAALMVLQKEMKQLKNGATLVPPSPSVSSGTTPAVTSLPTTAGGEGVARMGSLRAGSPVQAEKEIELEAIPEARPGLLPELLKKTRITSFLVGSFSYNSDLQMVPEFAGEIPAKANPQRTSFRFDKFGLGFSTAFAPWLQASALIEVENERAFDFEDGKFKKDEETEIVLEKFNLTAVAPIGNGLSLSLGRFDAPLGIEREDENLILTATQSEVFRFGRPNLMTGLQASYTFTPWLDVSAWVVNRWENEFTGEKDFNDNNREKTFGSRIGFTPFPREGLLNIGVGGFWGPEQTDRNSDKRWVVDVDFTWTPLKRLLVAGELIYGGESDRLLEEREGPIAAPEETKHVNWRGFYLLGHYEALDWLGLSFRYGLFDDADGGRTGVKQVLQSWTFAPIVHLSRLVPGLRPTGAAYARTRHPIDWVDLKLEYRLNHSNRPVFSDAGPGQGILEADKTGHQVELQVIVNFADFL